MSIGSSDVGEVFHEWNGYSGEELSSGDKFLFFGVDWLESGDAEDALLSYVLFIVGMNGVELQDCMLEYPCKSWLNINGFIL